MKECIWSETGTRNGVDYSHAQYFVRNDGGRQKSGFSGVAGDCVCRAIAIATGMEYRDVYSLINKYGNSERKSKHRSGSSSARSGVYKPTTKKIMSDLGFKWIPTMQIGGGCKTHLRADELPTGVIVCSVSKHLVAVIDGVIHDTHDCSRRGTRCVYGYWVL